MKSNGYTPTEQRLMDLLGDGSFHAMGEVLKAMPDELAGKEVLKVHIFNLRKKLVATGRDVVCVSLGKYNGYRMVRLLNTQD